MTSTVHERPTGGHQYYLLIFLPFLVWTSQVVFILISDTTPLNSVIQNFIVVNEAADSSKSRIYFDFSIHSKYYESILFQKIL